MLLILSLLFTLLASGISRPSPTKNGVPINEISQGLPKLMETLIDDFNMHKEVLDKKIKSGLEPTPSHSAPMIDDAIYEVEENPDPEMQNEPEIGPEPAEHEEMQEPEASDPVETISDASEAEKQEFIVETNMESFEANIPPAEMPAVDEELEEPGPETEPSEMAEVQDDVEEIEEINVETFHKIHSEDGNLDAELETEPSSEPAIEPLEPVAETSDAESETEPFEPAAEEAETSESEVEPEVEPAAETSDAESETQPFEPAAEEAETSVSEGQPEAEPAAESSDTESESEHHEQAAGSDDATVMEEPNDDIAPETEPDQLDDMEPEAESDA